MKIACLLANGFEETEALQTVDILRRADLSVDLISIDQLVVVGSHGIKVIADGVLDSLDGYDMLILPGGQPGTNNLKKNNKVIEAVIEFNKNKKWLAAICAAPTVFDAAKILDSVKVTSYPGLEKEAFKTAIYLTDAVVMDGHIITSRGVGTVADFAFAILSVLGIDPNPLKTAMVFKS